MIIRFISVTRDINIIVIRVSKVIIMKITGKIAETTVTIKQITVIIMQTTEIIKEVTQ